MPIAPTESPAPDDAPAQPEPWLSVERLDCYRVALEFQTLAADLVRQRGLGALRDQLDRASVSIVLNIAEAVGRTAAADRAHFFAIARGSATECAAIVDLLLARGLACQQNCRRARSLLVRIVQMLSRLIQRPLPNHNG